MNIVDEYWNARVVGNYTGEEDLNSYIDKRLSLYPHAYSLFEFYDTDFFKDKVVLDYGYGPGFDSYWLLNNTELKKLYMMDISYKATSLAEKNVSTCPRPERANIIMMGCEEAIETSFEFIHEKVDIIICNGVLHHTSNPTDILGQFNKILKDNGVIKVMVYNRESIFYHLCVSYEVAERWAYNYIYSNEEIARKSVDGGNCPIVTFYKPTEFKNLCKYMGFKTLFLGGYTDPRERIGIEDRIQEALLDPCLKVEQRDFLKDVVIVDDVDPIPMYHGDLCGIGGVYKLTKEII